MNGRIYDSEIARFISPDPIIQDQYNILSYNRYTYCLNNPLKYTDPSGYNLSRPNPFEYAFPTNYNEAWEQQQNSDSQNSGCNYLYNPEKDEYRDRSGKIVLFSEVYNNYILPNSFNADGQVGFDIAKAINYLIDNTSNSSQKGLCATWIIKALSEGGITGINADAWEIGDKIAKRGFDPIANTNLYSPMNGDIVVFDRTEDHKMGHTAMWCEGQWVSDFKQGWIGEYDFFKQGGLGFNVWDRKISHSFTIYRYNWYPEMQ